MIKETEKLESRNISILNTIDKVENSNVSNY